MSKDRNAGRRVRELRIDRGHTPETLSYEIAKRDPRYAVSGRTIRRVEDGAIPNVRAMFGIALAFEMVPSQIWMVASQRKVAA